MSCKFCGKTFNRRFNLKRHESDYCPLRHENSDTDDEFQDMKSDDDDISTASNSEHTQSSEADGSESGSGSEVENESDPWEPLIEEAKERNVSEYEEIKQNFIERGLDEESASSQAYSLILPKLQKGLERIYLERLFWNKGDFCLIGQFFLRLSLINFTSGSGRLEKADKDFKKQQGLLA